MMELGLLLKNTVQVVVLLFHVVTLWPGSVIKFFLPKQRKDITGEIMFMTGAGSGIGRAMSLKFAELGAILISTDLNAATAEETAKMIKENGGKAYAYQLDVTDKEKVYALAEQVKNEVGEVTMLVNNAGIVTGRPLMECPDNLILKTMEVNTIAHFWTIKAFLGSMLKKNHGHIVTIASIAGHAGGPALVDYCASKYAAVGIHDSLTVELTRNPDNAVKTSSVCPYLIKTGMFEGVADSSPLLMPFTETGDAAEAIVTGVLNNDLEIYVPRSMLALVAAKGICPNSLLTKIVTFLKIQDSMNNFVGRTGQKKKGE